MSTNEENAQSEVSRVEPPYLGVSAQNDGTLWATWVYQAQGRNNDTLIRWTWPDGENEVHLAAGTTRYTISNLIPLQQYRVCAYGLKDGEESIADCKNVTTLEPALAPAMPKNLQAFAQRQLMDLKWSASHGATSYKVSFGLAPNGNAIRTQSSSESTYRWEGLLPDTLYWFQVVAINGVGESPPARVLERTLKPTGPTDPQPPETPGNFVVAPAVDTMQLQWSASARASEYSIYYHVYPSCEPTTITTQLLTATLENLSRNTRYYVEVSAVNAYGASEPPASAIISTLAEYPPVPTQFNNDIKFAEVRVSWRGSSPEYEVKWGLTNKYPETVGAQVIDRDHVVLEDLLPDTSYFFNVRAKNGSAYSVQQSSPFAIGPDCTQPRNLRYPGRTDCEAWLKWDEPLDNAFLIDYEITCPGIQAVQTTECECIVTGLTPDTEYVFTVQPRRPPERRRPLSAFVSLTTHDYVPPTRPQKLKLTASTRDSAQLSWAASADNVKVIGYEMRRNGGAWVEVSGTSCPVGDLVEGDTFEVRARDAAGNVSVRAYLTHKNKSITVPSAPTNFRFTAGLVPTLRWDRPAVPAGMLGYEVTITGLGAELPYKSDDEILRPLLAPFVRYDVVIKAYNSEGYSSALLGVIPGTGDS